MTDREPPTESTPGDEPSAGDDSATADDTPLTHTDGEGKSQVVDIGEKSDTKRRAVAAGEIRLQESTIEAVRANETRKGDVLATARIGAVQAVKHTWETIPMCHAIPITNVEATFDVGAETITLTVAVETVGKTGCEMEALQGVTTGLNVVWDMVKAAEKGPNGGYPETGIEAVRVLEKTKTAP